MAYLTLYSFGKLAREIEIRNAIDKDLFVELIYHSAELYYILNKRELQTLFAYRGILDDEKNFKMEFFQEVPLQEDKKVYVYEKNSKVKYHLSQNCALLTNDFQAFYIPNQIREINDDNLTEQYRNWFKGHGFKDEYLVSLNSGDTQRIQKRIVDDYNYKFIKQIDNFVLDPLPMNFEFYNHIDNSKSKFTKEKFDKIQFANQMHFLIKQHDEYFNSHELRRFAKFSGLKNEPIEYIKSVLSDAVNLDLIKRFGIDKLRHAWSVSSAIKQEIMQLLFKYFRWSYNFHQKDFDVITLEHFGLECCSRCEKLMQKIS